MHKSFYSLRKYKVQMIFGPIFKMLEVFFELLVPLIMKQIIDIGIPNAMNNGQYNDILWRGGLILGFCILGFSSTAVCQYFSSIASQGFGTDLRNRVIRKINDLSLQDTGKYSDGYLLNLVNNDINRMQLGVAMIVRLIIRAPAIVIGSLAFSFIINYKIGLIYLISVILISFFLFLILKYNNKKFVSLQIKNDQLSQIVDDGLNGARVIRSFNAQEIEIEKYKKKTSDYLKDAKKVNNLNSLINPITFLIINTCIVLTIYVASNTNIQNSGDFSTGNIVALVSYLNQMFVALIVVTNLVVIFNKFFVAKKRLDDFLLLDNSIKNEPKVDQIIISKNEPLFEFKNVSFRYNNGGNVAINNVTFSIKNGDSVGIIGGTGCGKTTIVKLFERFFDCSSGVILYKGVNIKDYNLTMLRNELSLVNQKTVLFKGTIKSNLLLGNEIASIEDINLSLKRAMAYEFVFGYSDNIDHIVEENGKNFSGGQKQRLSIARSLLKKSETYIFDDSTSSLDYLTEKSVRKNIENISNTTKIYISQRASSIMNCDQIIVMDKGAICGIGKHTDLLENCSVYKEIYDSQVRVENEK